MLSATQAFLIIGLLFTFVNIIFNAINIILTPVSAIVGIDGLVLWNTIAGRVSTLESRFQPNFSHSHLLPVGALTLGR